MTIYKITLLVTAPDEREDGDPICLATVLEAVQECGTELAADLEGEFDDNDAIVEEVTS